MKQITTWLLVLVFWSLTTAIKAQPEGIQYQAVIRNAAGTPLINQAVQLRMGIFRGGMMAVKVFEEQHNVTTNNFGLAQVVIGNGTVLFGTFSSINWNTGAFFLNVEINTGSGFVDLGRTQFFSVPFALYAKDAGNDNDSQNLSISGNTLSISGGNSVILPSSGLTLPYSGSSNSVGTNSFEINNTSTGLGAAITGRLGASSSLGPISASAIFGTSRHGYGVVGYSSITGLAGVMGHSDFSGGYGVQGIGSNGALGGYFESTGSGAALATSSGNVGIGVADPDVKLEVNGTLRVNSNVGRLELGNPSSSGDKWYFNTNDGGKSMQLYNQEGTSLAALRMFFNREGLVVIGNTTITGGKLKVKHNSNVSDPQLLLLEEGSDYSRITFQNERESSSWSIAGYTQSDSSQDRLNFFHSGFGDVLSLNGKGIVGIRTISPISDLHLIHREIKSSTEIGLMGMRLQNAGTNGNFWNLYVQNSNGNLELYFKNAIKGRFNDGTGVYSAVSDERMKQEIRPMGEILQSVIQLQPKRYRFKNQSADEPATIGFLSQEVAHLFPELVQHSGDGGADIYTIDYSGFGILAVKAIQEQQQVIDNQQRKIEELQRRMEKLENAISQLKNQ